MTPEQLEICNALSLHVTYQPGSWDKRMGNSLIHLTSLTESQNEWMYRLLYKYRRQIPAVYEKYKGHPFCSKAKTKL